MEKDKLIKQWSEQLKTQGFDNRRDWKYLTERVRKNLNIKRLRMAKRTIKYVSLDEIRQMLQMAHQMQLSEEKEVRGLIIELIIKIGLDSKQLINLKIQDIDFESHLLKIKIKNKDYYSIIPKSLIPKIKNHTKNRTKGYLFINNRRTQYSLRSTQLIIKDVKIQCKIKKLINPQTLKNVFGTILIEEGIDKEYIQKLKQEKNIMSIYTHMLGEETQNE